RAGAAGPASGPGGALRLAAAPPAGTVAPGVRAPGAAPRARPAGDGRGGRGRGTLCEDGVGATAPPRGPGCRRARSRIGGARRSAAPASHGALGGTTAAGADRQGAGERTAAAHSRRADRGRRRPGPTPVPGLTRPPLARARRFGPARVTRARRRRRRPRPRRRPASPCAVRREAGGPCSHRREPRRACRRPASLARGAVRERRHVMPGMPWPLPWPFDTTYMQLALVAGIAVGASAPLIGTFLVQKRLSLLGDGIGHVAVAGIGAGLLFGTSPTWTALVVSVGAALALEWLRSRGRTSGDLALALFFYGGIAAGVVLAGRSATNANLQPYLFGSILTVTENDVYTVAALGALIVASIAFTRRGLLAGGLDGGGPRGARLPGGAPDALPPALP